MTLLVAECIIIVANFLVFAASIVAFSARRKTRRLATASVLRRAEAYSPPLREPVETKHGLSYKRSVPHL